MHRTNHHLATQDDGQFPWEVAHAAPEDRAVGLELQLIELVARRRAIRHETDPEAGVIDAEIEGVLIDLGDLTPSLPLAG